MEKVSQYERERAERIQANQEQMKAIFNIQQPTDTPLSTEAFAGPAILATRKSVPEKRKRESLEAKQTATRRSARIRGEEANKVDASEIASAGDEGEGDDSSRARHSVEDIRFTSANATPADDLAMLSLLKSELAPRAAKQARGDKSSKKREDATAEPVAFAALRLADSDVAKVTHSSVTHLAFMPNGALLVAAADKRGNVGLWNVDPDSDQTSSDFDGVLAFRAHQQYVSGLVWAANGLLTCSYDGSVRRLDAERAAFMLAWGAAREYSAFEASADGNSLFLGDVNGTLDVVDVRAGAVIHSVAAAHARKINTIHLDAGCGATRLVTASTDTTLRLWDARWAKSACIATASHRQTCQAAYFAPDGSGRVLSTSFDNTVRVWDASKALAPVVTIAHNNHTGRWVLPLRAVWARSDVAVIGSMQRGVDVLATHTADEGKAAKAAKAATAAVAPLQGPAMTAITARVCVHPTLEMVCAGSSSGRLHLFRTPPR